MQANAADPAGAASLMSAVEQHDPSVLGSGLDQIDTQDGQRIVQNVFGEQTPDVMNRLGGATPGQGSSLIQKLLPIIAPIVIGAVGVLIRRSAIMIFLSVELMLNAANLALVAFARGWAGAGAAVALSGQAAVFIILAVAAAEVAVGLGILVAIFRYRYSADVDTLAEVRR